VLQLSAFGWTLILVDDLLSVSQVLFIRQRTMLPVFLSSSFSLGVFLLRMREYWS
jgi:hypothetical protein